jgi:hypothetical protein
LMASHALAHHSSDVTYIVFAQVQRELGLRNQTVR